MKYEIFERNPCLSKNLRKIRSLRTLSHAAELLKHPCVALGRHLLQALQEIGGEAAEHQPQSFILKRDWKEIEKNLSSTSTFKIFQDISSFFIIFKHDLIISASSICTDVNCPSACVHWRRPSHARRGRRAGRTRSTSNIQKPFWHYFLTYSIHKTLVNTIIFYKHYQNIL